MAGDVETEIVDGDVELIIDLRVYGLDAVRRAAYRLAARFTAVIRSPDDHLLPITLQFKSATSPDATREAVRAFYEELLDQDLRERIGNETSATRALIMAQAFSNVDLIKRSQ